MSSVLQKKVEQMDVFYCDCAAFTVAHTKGDCAPVWRDVCAGMERQTMGPHHPEHDFWMTHPDDPDYLAPADRWCRVCALPDSHMIHKV